MGKGVCRAPHHVEETALCVLLTAYGLRGILLGMRVGALVQGLQDSFRE